MKDADYQQRDKLEIEGSPTFILDQGCQKLFGNLGYRVIEANIHELLREPSVGEMSWCQASRPRSAAPPRLGGLVAATTVDDICNMNCARPGASETESVAPWTVAISVSQAGCRS